MEKLLGCQMILPISRQEGNHQESSENPLIRKTSFSKRGKSCKLKRELNELIKRNDPSKAPKLEHI